MKAKYDYLQIKIRSKHIMKADLEYSTAVLAQLAQQKYSSISKFSKW